MVLDHLKTWESPSNLSLADLTRKTAFLLALVTARRVKALSNLSIILGLMEVTPNAVWFNPAYLLPLVMIRKFDKASLDPVLHLQSYINRTRAVCTFENLFDITIRPHATAT